MAQLSADVPFKEHDPPLDPPPGCVNRLMWQVARRLYADHWPGLDGWCAVCRPYQFYPCVARQLAELGLEAAYQVPDGAPWRVVLPPAAVPALVRYRGSAW